MKPGPLSLYGVLVDLADCTMSQPRGPFRSRNRWRGGGSRGFSCGGPSEEVLVAGDPGFSRGRGREFGFRQGERDGFQYRGRGRSLNGVPRVQFRPRPPRRTDDYRHWEYVATLPPSDCERFIVVSYNILADYLARDHQMKLYNHIPPHILDWAWRKSRILLELGLWGPDIMCLQEVDKFQELHDELKSRGYSGTWKMRTGLPVDGCAMFWRSDRFVLLHEENIEFNQLGLRDNVAQICVFESRNESQAEKGSGASSASFHWLKRPKQLVVCNIHVLYNPNRGEIKVGQVRVLLDRAYAVSRLWGDAPVVICGDFNCTPKSPLYNFISQQKLELSGLARNEISGQYTAHVGVPVLNDNHNLHRTQDSPCIQGNGRTDGCISYMKDACNQPRQSNIEHASPAACLLANKAMVDMTGMRHVTPAAECEKDGDIHLVSVEPRITGEKLPPNDAGKSEELCLSLDNISGTANGEELNLLSVTDSRVQNLSLKCSSVEDGKVLDGDVELTHRRMYTSLNMQMKIGHDAEASNSSAPSIQLKTEPSDNTYLEDSMPAVMLKKMPVHCEDLSHLNADVRNNFIRLEVDANFRESSGPCNTMLSDCGPEVHEAGSDSHASTSDAFRSLQLPSDPRNEKLSLEGSPVSAFPSGVISPSPLLDNFISEYGEIDVMVDGLIASHELAPNLSQVISQGGSSMSSGPGDGEEKKLHHNPCTWSPAEIEAATGNAVCTCVEHHLQLRSVYTEVEDFAGTRDLSREPQVTSYNRRFMGTVDYIWCSEGLQTIKVLDTLPKHILQRTSGFPTHKWGSDHLALACQLAFRDVSSPQINADPAGS